MITKPRIDLDEDNLVWAPLVSREIPIYESDNDVYNILFDNDNISNENGNLKNGSKTPNGMDDKLKKKRRRRWYKAYNNSRRRRRPAKSNNTVVSTKSRDSSEEEDEEEEEDEISHNISHDDCDEDTEEENDENNDESDITFTLNGTIDHESESQSPDFESNSCDNFIDEESVNAVRKRLKFDSESHDKKNSTSKLKRRKSVNGRISAVKKLKMSPRKYSVILNGNGKLNGKLSASEDDGSASPGNINETITNGNCSPYENHQDHNNHILSNGNIDH